MLLHTMASGLWRTAASTKLLVRDFGIASPSDQRRKRLLEIYAPFAKLEKNSPEYNALAYSGKVWEDYHHPGDSAKQGYEKLHQKHTEILAEIDSLKKSMELPVCSIAKSLVTEYAHQSVQIENNRLKLGDSIKIYDFLSTSFFKQFDLSTMSSQRIYEIDIPDVTFLLPAADTSQTRELANHIVASQWVAETAC